MKKLKKFLSILLITVLLFSNTAHVILAQEAGTSGEADSAQEAEQQTPPAAEPTPEPQASEQPTAVSSPAPSASPASVSEANTSGEAQSAQEADDHDDEDDDQAKHDQEDESNDDEGDFDWTSGNANTGNNSTPITTTGPGGQDENGAMGDTTITTGTADASAIVINNANTNLGSAGGSAGDIYVGNTGNGDGSSNSGSVDTTNDSSTIQNNNADVDNNVGLEALSGNNSASGITGGNATIVTGEANATATVINGVNTNIDGVAVIEFNIDDTHNGDVVLSFPTISGCTATVCNGNAGDLTAENTGNGQNSTNDAGITTNNTDSTFQNNTADVTNNLVLIADSGSNETNGNTGGDNSITTNDANVVATVGNFVNNNIAGAGQVLIAVVNIFGDLIGNILLPESSLAGNGSGGTTVANQNNGQYSTNNAGVNTNNYSSTTQNNDADITNNLDVSATTGANEMNGNTAGFTSGGNVIETGEASVDVNVVNIANTNLMGSDTWWLVFVNDASGNWVGHIMGAPDGATMAGSAGTEFVMLADGTIVAQNVGNGEGSTNNANVDTNNSSTLEQNNTATINNNLTLAANTGHNSASGNTGGSNSITTGNANVMANITNFVNNNFAGGNVVVSIINVFGSWLGSFVPPGEEAPHVAVGGAETQNHSNAGNQNNNSSNSNNSTTNQATQAEVLGAEDEGVEVAFNWNGWKLGGTTNTGSNNPPPGTVIEDDGIIVPGATKTAGAKTVIPSWFWKVFAASLTLVILKKISQKLKLKKIAPAASI